MAEEEEKITMRGNYAEDTFTENDVLACLDAAGLRHKNGGRYILTQCPLHEDQNASAQVYKDDWFVKCHAGCEGGRFHITKAFPELRGTGTTAAPAYRPNKAAKKVEQVKYVEVELRDQWAAMPLIPDDHEFKGLPIEHLNDLGWRWDAAHNRYFIPYFDRSKKFVPFAQWRNLTGSVRFNFWKDARPLMYGMWNLEPGDILFLVEGCSDAAVLDYCMVPWIAAPSAASGELVKAMAGYCIKNDIGIIYAGDNDEAGDKLKDALSEVMNFRVKQPRKPYKDWGEMFEAEGVESVQKYCFDELFPNNTPMPDVPFEDKTDLEKIQTVFPGAEQLTIVGDGKEATQNHPH